MKPLPTTLALLTVAQRVVWFKEPADALADPVNRRGITICPSDGWQFLFPQVWTAGAYYGTEGTFFADVTGDGSADAIAVTNDDITVRPSDGVHFLLPQSWTTGPYYGTGGTAFADVTGDGAADAIAVNTDKISVRPSIGMGFFSPQSWTIGPYFGNLSPICGN